MASPDTPHWTEALLEELEPTEHDFQEFKGSGWLIDGAGDLRHGFQLTLSKQISAFANGAGGRLFVGIDDRGVIDGGVPKGLKGGGVRAWLEDVVPHCVDPHLQACNVFEVGHAGELVPSRIIPGNAVYIIDIPPSDRAPHQAKDHRYYLRIAGKSRPMGHVHIQDVLRRTRHPRIRLSRVGPYGEALEDISDPRGRRAFVQLRAFLNNEGHNLANHVGVELIVPRSLAGREVRIKMREAGEAHLTQAPGELTFFRYHPTPVFPTQEVYALSAWICLHRNNLALVRSGGGLAWTIYADDAPPERGEIPLGRFAVVNRAIRWVEEG